jgi:hypothetical protein
MHTEKQDSTEHDICLTCFPFKSALAGFHLASIRAIETMLLPISVKIGGSGIIITDFCPAQIRQPTFPVQIRFSAQRLPITLLSCRARPV